MTSMYKDKIIIGSNDKNEQSHLLLKMANRHGLIAGATGTGKTITLKVLSEEFAKKGIPVFLTDVKGDLSGFINEGSEHTEVTRRIEHCKIKNFDFTKFPTVFWDLYNERGHAARTTLSELGPILLSQLLELNDTQEDLISLAFKYADENGMLLLDTKDLKSILSHLANAKDEDLDDYGRVAKSSVGAITRRLSALEEAGGGHFFGEPALDIKDFIKADFSGNGIINILNASKLMLDQRLYSTFLLWFLSELLEELPERGDAEKPKMVLFFDEAHLVFKSISKPLLQKIEMVVKLIRSKGIGVYFVTQDPSDIPSEVLAQLGNRIVHALRSFTASDRRAIKAISESFRTNPELNVIEEISNLKIGESLVSFLDEDGSPTMVEKILNAPPCSQMGPAEDSRIKELIELSPYHGKYTSPIDRESAFEVLKKKKKEAMEKMAKRDKSENSSLEKLETKKSTRQTPLEAFFKSMLRSIGSGLGRQIIRGILGSFKR